MAEGQAAPITEENLAVSHPYYEGLVDNFIVIQKPKYGSITYMQVSAKSFTPLDLKEGRIWYNQDR